MCSCVCELLLGIDPLHSLTLLLSCYPCWPILERAKLEWARAEVPLNRFQRQNCNPGGNGSAFCVLVFHILTAHFQIPFYTARLQSFGLKFYLPLDLHHRRARRRILTFTSRAGSEDIVSHEDRTKPWTSNYIHCTESGWGPVVKILQ